jgi:hypothetical protein
LIWITSVKAIAQNHRSSLPKPQSSQNFIGFKNLMSSATLSMNQTINHFRDLFSLLFKKTSHMFQKNNKQHKVHTYSGLNNSKSFVLSVEVNNPYKHCMSAYGTGIKAGDFIVIEDSTLSMKFKVDSINYYLDPPDFWMASLTRDSYMPEKEN